ncbi:MAG TPA: transketolase, partial [Actinopolymorphaceae bacterium]
WRVQVPGHPDEVRDLLADAFHHEESTYVRLSTQSNRVARPGVVNGALQVVRDGGGPVVIAVGPMLDRTLEATAGLDVAVAYTTTVRPLDAEGLRSLAVDGDVVLVEPYLSGTSSRYVDEALSDRPHRTLSLGVERVELRRYGTPADHDELYGLDAAGLRRSITSFVAG